VEWRSVSAGGLGILRFGIGEGESEGVGRKVGSDWCSVWDFEFELDLVSSRTEGK
jgi:hypothetical protein